MYCYLQLEVDNFLTGREADKSKASHLVLQEELEVNRSDYTTLHALCVFVLRIHTTKALGRLHFFFLCFKNKHNLLPMCCYKPSKS